MSTSYKTVFGAGLAVLAAATFLSGSTAMARVNGQGGSDVIIGNTAAHDRVFGHGGQDVLIRHTRGGRRAGPARLTVRRSTDLEWRGMFVNPVGGWKGSGAASWVSKGTTLKIRDIITRKAAKIPGDTRPVLVVNRLVRLSPAPKRVVIHKWTSQILKTPGGPTGEIHDFKYRIGPRVRPGKYQICMVIDPRNKIKETKENNNRYCYGPFWIRPRPHR